METKQPTQEQIKELEKRIEAVEKGKADKTHFHREKPISVVGKPIKEPWIPEVIV